MEHILAVKSQNCYFNNPIEFYGFVYYINRYYLHENLKYFEKKGIDFFETIARSIGLFF